MTRRIPTLDTERLLINELAMDDLETINQVLDEATGRDTPIEDRARWLQWTVLGYEMFAMLEQPYYGERAMTLKDTGELIGAVGIVPYIDFFDQIAAFNSPPEGHTTAEVGLYWSVAPAHKRQGYATEAARVVVDYRCAEMKLGRVIATTGYNNVASQAVMRKIGMTVEHANTPQPPDIYVVGVLDNPSATKAVA